MQTQNGASEVNLPASSAGLGRSGDAGGTEVGLGGIIDQNDGTGKSNHRLSVGRTNDVGGGNPVQGKQSRKQLLGSTEYAATETLSDSELEAKFLYRPLQMVL